MNTKEKILNSALDLFAENGYHAVTVRDIAAKVGIKASSLYNHFESKQNILDELIKINIRYISNLKKTLCSQNTFVLKKNSNVDSFDIYFLDNSLKIIKLYFKDHKILKFRKLLSIEQCRNSTIASLYQEIFINSILEYESKFFKYLINENILLNKDPYILALEFYSPIFLLLHNKDKISRTNYESVEKHILNFKETYYAKG
ncbi:MAG: TetR/AcrR family transcriptional regulator [Clostridium sp.]